MVQCNRILRTLAVCLYSDFHPDSLSIEAHGRKTIPSPPKAITSLVGSTIARVLKGGTRRISHASVLRACFVSHGECMPTT